MITSSFRDSASSNTTALHRGRTRCKGTFHNVADLPNGAANTRNAQGARAHFTMSQICPNGAANTRNALGARAHFTVSLISNCRWGIGAIAVLPGVSLWINQRLNTYTLGLQPSRKAGFLCSFLSIVGVRVDSKVHKDAH